MHTASLVHAYCMHAASIPPCTPQVLLLACRKQAYLYLFDLAGSKNLKEINLSRV